MNKIYISQYELKHYASPYYDPVKAHEYYEEHKKIKGRTAGRTLTDKGKEAKLYVTDQIRSAKKAQTEKAKADREKAKADRDKSIDDSKSSTQRDIDNLQNEMLSMSKDELKRKGPMYARKIANLKKQNSDAKNKARQDYSDKIKSIRESNKAKQEELSNTLKAELEKMLLDPETGKDSGSSNSSNSNVKGSSAESQTRIKQYSERFKSNPSKKVDSGSKEDKTGESKSRIGSYTERFKKK